jgi:hypothetical protein
MSQPQAAGDEQQLTAVFNRFAKLQTIHMPLQVLTMVALAWALVAHITVR